MEDSGNGGERQMTSIFSATCGFSRPAKTRPTLLLVAMSSTPLATEKTLAWWLAERTALKHLAGSMSFGVNR